MLEPVVYIAASVGFALGIFLVACFAMFVLIPNIRRTFDGKWRQE